jgi:HEAT repeat protein
VPHIVRQLSPEASDRTRQTAAAVLYGFGPRAKEALPTLLEVAGSEGASATTRVEAARAALEVDLDAARGSEAVRSLVPVLVSELEGPDFKARGRAAETLGLIGPAAREALPALQRALQLPPQGFDTGGLVKDFVRQYAEMAIATIELESG